MTNTAVHSLYCLAGEANPFLKSLDKVNALPQYQCCVYFNFEELIAAIKVSCPDGILIDLDAPHIQPQFDAVMQASKNFKLQSHLPIIVLTAHPESRDLLDAIEKGADDFFSPNLNFKIIQTKLDSYFRVQSMQAVLQSQREEIERNHQQLMLEQQIAKEVFDKVAHDGCINIPNIQHWLSPIAVFNGDVLLSTITPGGNLLVLLGDFTGHGLPAAIGAMPLASTFYGMAQKGFSMLDILKELNKKLHEILPVSVFCCAGMMHINFEKGLFEVCNAGLPDCILVRGANALKDETLKPVELLASQNLALGILNSRDYKPVVQSLSVVPGDRLLLMSDGILEAPNHVGEHYGEQRLLDFLDQHYASKSLFDELKNHIENYIAEEERVDDISLVEVSMIDALAFKSLYEGEENALVQQPVSWSLNFELRHESLQNQDPIPMIMHMLMEVPRLRFYSGQLYTILTELFVNALDHGLLELSSAIKNNQQGFAQYFEERVQRLAELGAGSITFKLDYRGDTNSGLLLIDVIDTGKGFDYVALKNKATYANTAEVTQFHGRGIPLIESICKQIDYLDAGNHARVAFEWNSHPIEEAYVK